MTLTIDAARLSENEFQVTITHGTASHVFHIRMESSPIEAMRHALALYANVG
jgi:hypothetical protein